MMPVRRRLPCVEGKLDRGDFRPVGDGDASWWGRHRQYQNPPGRKGGRGPGGPGGQRPAPRELPQGYLRSGYFDSAGHPRKEILVDEAKSVADVLAGTTLAANKLVGLYNRTRVLKDKFAQTGDFDALRADIYGLLTDAVDATGRGVTPDVFRKFVEANINLAVIDEKGFRDGFIEHLRAVRAWFLLARATSNPGRR